MHILGVEYQCIVKVSGISCNSQGRNQVGVIKTDKNLLKYPTKKKKKKKKKKVKRQKKKKKKKNPPKKKKKKEEKKICESLYISVV